MSYVCTIKINKEMKNLKNTYSLFNNPSLLGADKVWYNFNITLSSGINKNFT